MLYVSVGLLVVTVLFSFLSFLTMGRYRINRENKFYDAVAFDCGWERSYKGREAKRVIPKWQGLKIESLTLNIDKASYVTTSINKWKTIKMSVLDEFPLKASGLVTIFDNHSQGKLTFQAYDPARETAQDKSLVFKESLYAYVYEMIGRPGQPLPVLTISLGNDQDGLYVDSMHISTSSSVERYTQKTFESNFKRTYHNDDRTYTFTWGQNTVEIKSFERGSDEDRIIQGSKSLIELMGSSINGSFYGSLNKDYILTPEMITWGQDNIMESLTIDFTHSDISRPDHVEKFEMLANQGLYQLFKHRQWDFAWDISAFEKSVTITKKIISVRHNGISLEGENLENEVTTEIPKRLEDDVEQQIETKVPAGTSQANTAVSPSKTSNLPILTATTILPHESLEEPPSPIGDALQDGMDAVTTATVEPMTVSSFSENKDATMESPTVASNTASPKIPAMPKRPSFPSRPVL